MKNIKVNLFTSYIGNAILFFVLSSSLTAKEPQEFVSLREEWKKSRELIDSQYIVNMTKLLKQLIADERLDEAILVRNEISRVEQNITLSKKEAIEVGKNSSEKEKVNSESEDLTKTIDSMANLMRAANEIEKTENERRASMSSDERAREDSSQEKMLETMLQGLKELWSYIDKQSKIEGQQKSP